MKGTLRPERLPMPQSSGAVVQYGRRMLTQLREWVLLDVNLTIGPYKYGWGLINKEVGYYPVYNTDPVEPPELLNLTFRKCKGFGCVRITRAVTTRTKLSVSLLLVIDVHCTDELSCGNVNMAEGRGVA